MERQRKQKDQHIAENYRLAAILRSLGHANGGFCNICMAHGALVPVKRIQASALGGSSYNLRT